MTALFLLYLIFSLANASTNNAPKLLNAYRSAPNSVETSMLPQRSYFLEFPLEDASFAAPRLAPLCSNRSPFSFLFKRGTNAHFRKILVEFEGGPACYNADCGCDAHARQTPWKDYHLEQTVTPNLGTCSGIAPEFLQVLSPRLFGNATSTDVPLLIRQSRNDTTNSTWWHALSQDIDQWSYLLIPHCSMDWYLGYQAQGRWSGCQVEETDDPPFDGPWWDAPVYQGRERIWHRGHANLEGVLEWMVTQFGTNGLDAMITVSGGKIGGCSSNRNDPEYASTIAPVIFAKEAADTFEWKESSSILAILEGSSLFSPNFPGNEALKEPWNPKAVSEFSNLASDVGQMIVEAPEAMDVVWMASLAPSNVELQGLDNLQEAKPDRFHLFTPPNAVSMQNAAVSCPRFAFEDSTEEMVAFFDNLTKDKIYKSISSEATDSATSVTLEAKSSTSPTTKQLGYLSIAILFLGILVFAWAVYFVLKKRREKQGLSPPLSPNELWMKALTYYPLCFLLLSLLFPLVLSLVGFARSGYTIDVNLDFESYLDISSEMDIVANNYAAAQEFQADSVLEARSQCRTMGGDVDNQRRLQFSPWDQMETNNDLHTGRRRLQSNNAATTSERIAYITIYIIYQKRNGGNVFDPEVLASIFDFESYVRSLPDFETYCRRDKEECSPFDTPLTFLYQNETLVDNIEESLAAKVKGSQVDQYFAEDNLQSNITKSVMYFQGPQSEMDRFLDDLYRNFLWKRDQEKYYENMVYTWENGYLLRLEANDALYHDTLWSVGSFVVIGIMILLKVQDFFVFFFGMTGLLLAFTTSYYWCTTHFGIPDVTLLHVSGLFVMLGIGADDIFLMTDSYTHAEVDDEIASPSNGTSTEKEHEIIRKKMLWAYSTAGSMMLVSSMTAAVCFFSNGFGVLLVIQEFGIYMGIVVLINYFHVMTILPSAILVNEMYLKPWKRKVLPGWCLSKGHDGPRRSRIEMNGERTARAPSMPSSPDRIVTADDGVEISLGRSPEQDESAQEPAAPTASRLNRIDRLLLERYSPFLKRRRRWILGISLLFACLLGLFGFLNLKFSDGAIVIFSSEYNQGRLSSIQNMYYSISSSDSQSPASSPTDEGGSGLGNGGGSSCTGEDCSGTGGGTGGNSGGSGGGSGGGDNSGNGGGGSGGGGGGSGGGGSGDGNSTVAPIVIAPTPPTMAPTPALSASPSASDTISNATDTIGSSATIIEVKLIFGVGGSGGNSNGPWTVELQSGETSKEVRSEVRSLDGLVPSFDVSEPATQKWLLNVAEAARLDESLDVMDSQTTWIELFADFASNQIGGFPVPKELFTSYIEVLKSTNPRFSTLVEGEIGTDLPGLAGSSFYASITFRTYDSATLTTYEKWNRFSRDLNVVAPDSSVHMVAQSALFWNEARATEMVDATVMTWLIANLLCFAIILLFTQNILLCVMVMATILLMFLCIAGWLFAILQLPLGPVQALGLSIFIGLSANYSLHVVHAYHRSRSEKRETKVDEAIFITGSPIFASALSTIGGCVFLFGCRTVALVELGILICCVAAMALLYSMGFLLAWLLTIGPLPFGTEIGRYQQHRWDVCVLGKKYVSNAAEESRSSAKKGKGRKNVGNREAKDPSASTSSGVVDKHGLSGPVESESELFEL